MPTTIVRLPRSGDVLHLDARASVQFALNPFRFRVIRLLGGPMAMGEEEGWRWIDGYQLDEDGNAIERRSLYVNLAGVSPARR